MKTNSKAAPATKKSSEVSNLMWDEWTNRPHVPSNGEVLESQQNQRAAAVPKAKGALQVPAKIDKRRGKRVVPRPGEGRPAFAPTDDQRRQVKVAKGMGLTHEQVARLIGISRNTLEEHFRYELDNAQMMANFQVAQNLFHRTAHDQRATEFWLMNRNLGQWKSRQTVESKITVHDDRPDMSGLTAKQLAKVREVAIMLRGDSAKTIEHQPDEGDSHE